MNVPQMAMSDSAVRVYEPTNPVQHQTRFVRICVQWLDWTDLMAIKRSIFSSLESRRSVKY